MNKELLHYATGPVVFDRTRTYTQEEPLWFCKPKGLWVSVAGEDDWAAWCEAESYDLGPVVHRVVLRPTARVCWICDPDGLDGFHAAYAVETDEERRFKAAFGRVYKQKYWPLDWRKAASDFDGLIIAPYLWSLRLLGPQWYHGWDCASGCIWSTDAVASMEAVG
jgi:hypothetical protein